jgi:hypothetical protein
MISRPNKLTTYISWIVILCLAVFFILLASSVIKLPKFGIDDPRLTSYTGYVSDGPGSAGSIYTGEMKDGLFVGKGELVYPDKSIYIGEFKDGLFSGTGRFRSSEGWSYEGHWSEGLPNGKGTYEAIKGGIYRGNFEDGMPVIEEPEK